MADLKPRIERLVGRLVGGRGGGATSPGRVLPALRPGDAGFAEAVAYMVAMALDQYAREGAPLEIRVRWQERTFWFAADERDAEALGGDGVSRGRVWTARELIQLTALSSRNPRSLRAIALAKLAVDGGIAEVKRFALGRQLREILLLLLTMKFL